MKPNSRLLSLIAACAALALAGAACSRKPKGPPARPPATVQTAAATSMDAPVTIEAFGSAKDQASVDIVPQVSGVLVETLIRDGAAVTNGQPLFRIDPRDYESRVRQIEAAAAADRANLALSRLTLERNRPLREKELISQEDFDTMRTRVEAGEAQVRVDEATLEQARLNLARCTIAAPLAGLCSRRYVDDGNLVTAGQTKLTNIRSYDPMILDFSVSEQDLPLLRRAMAEGTVRLDVTPRGETNSTPGTLEFMDNAVSTQTGTIPLRGQARNPDRRLWAGQFITVRVIAGQVRGAVMVPEGAVQVGKQGAYLFVVSKENQAEMRVVRAGVRADGMIQIVSGVAAGEKVVVLGQLMLYPGAPVSEAQPLPAGGAMPAAGGRAGGAAKP